MKKIVFLFFIPLFISSCKHKSQQETNTELSARFLTKASSKIRYTLNGFPFSVANQMVQSFANDETITDSKTSIYFSQAVFHSMITTLKTDSADGFRVYFAKTTAGKNTIVVVSTFNAGPVTGNPTDSVHRDYFQSYESYFAMPNINGESHYDNDNGGALLYTNPNCGKDNCTLGDSHYISCLKAYRMVSAFTADDTSDPINSTSEWFDLKVLSSIDSVLQTDPTSGLRIYFAKHVDNDVDDEGDYLHCFLLIATNTVTNISGIQVHQDNYICIQVPKVSKRQVKNNLKMKKMLSGGSGGTGGGGEDNGEQCPDNCTGATLPQS